MIRVLVYIVLVFLLAAGFAWLADRPGAVVLHWQGYEIRASLMIAAIALAVLIAAIAFLGAIVRAVVQAPRMLDAFFVNRRRDRGYRALSTGMIAVGAGDIGTARRAARESAGLLAGEPLALLLSAQAAQLAGDGARARTAFEALAARPETRILGLHGLFIEARRQGEHEAARHFAEEAARLAPKIGWAGTALFEYRSRAGDWAGALQALAANAAAKLIAKDEARRLRAVLLTARAIELEPGGPAEARTVALEAHRLQPDLTEAAIVAARLLARAGEYRRAARVLETAWKITPHPEIADAYAAVRPGDSVLDRLKRVRRLAELRPNHAEASMGVARAAIDARDWPAARTALEELAQSRPSERVCLLMAEIEEGEHGDQGRVRSWLTRALSAPRDPAWVADGQVFDRWSPLSPVSGRIGAFEWKVVATPAPPPEAVELETTRFDRPAIAAPLPEATNRDTGVIDAVSADAPLAADASAEQDQVRAPGPPLEPAPSLIRAPDDPGTAPPPSEEETPPRRRFRLFS
jgi:HemY protein